MLWRSNEVKQAAEDDAPAGSFSGNTGDGCGDPHPVTVSGAYGIGAFATANLPSDDIVLKLIGPGGGAVASSDTGTSPEAVNYSNNGAKIADGTYQLVVCQFADPTVPASGDSLDYTGGYAVNTVGGAPSTAGNPSWQYFKSDPGAGSQITGCYLQASGCDVGLNTTASRGAWDVLSAAGAPTFTTQGNNARTAEARFTPLTPGPFGFMPTSLTREYRFPFADQWKSSQCDPAPLAVPGSGADVSAAVTNLFAGHNRMHDFAYHLGFTEGNYNLQQSNFGVGKDGDPEVGNVQAGALTGGAPSYLGRDNANQITLNDGIPGITNQYLFQPIAGAFYGPCVDGDLDASVFGHEYTHAISNRMIGGPDDGITGFQGGAMGESWSRPRRHGVPAHARRDARGRWARTRPATTQVGIRDYALDANPLNYSDIGFDLTGPEVHADGEVWNAVNYDAAPGAGEEVRRASSRRPTRRCSCAAPTAGRARPRPRRRCRPSCARATGAGCRSCSTRSCSSRATRACSRPATPTWPPTGCASAAPTRPSCGTSFAQRGMGESASTDTTEDDQPMPAFDSPLADEATVTFATNAPGDGLHRPLRGARHAGRRHRPGDRSRREREARRRDLRRARARRRLRPAAVQADREGRPDADADLHARRRTSRPRARARQPPAPGRTSTT